MDIDSLSLFAITELSGQNPVKIAKRLIGCYLVLDDQIGGKIVETEAYWAPKDKASHAYNNKRIARTECMFEAAGTIYVYLVYGIHSLFNIVTGPKEVPHAVLIRAVEPIWGKAEMLQNRKVKDNKSLTNGPGKWTQAFGIDLKFNRLKLQENRVILYDRKTIPDIQNKIRIGIDYAEEYKDKKWRFIDPSSKYARIK